MDIQKIIYDFLSYLFEPAVVIVIFITIARLIIGIMQCFRSINERVKIIEEIRTKIVGFGANDFARRGLVSSGARDVFEEYWKSEAKNTISLIQFLKWQGKNKESAEAINDLLKMANEEEKRIDDRWYQNSINSHLKDIVLALNVNLFKK